MDQTTDQIKREIEEARERISEKTSQIGERIRSTFDWRQQVADHPWAAVGAAAAAGFLVGAAAKRALGGGRSYAAERYGEAYAPERAGQEAEAQAPPAGAPGSEWAGAAAGRTVAGTMGAERQARRPEEGRRWEVAAGGLTAALVGALGPQLQEIGRSLAEQLKNLSDYFITQGTEYVKERVDEWRGRPRTAGAGVPAQPAPGGSSLSFEAAGGRPAGSTTGTGATAGRGSPESGAGQTGR